MATWKLTLFPTLRQLTSIFMVIRDEFWDEPISQMLAVLGLSVSKFW